MKYEIIKKLEKAINKENMERYIDYLEKGYSKEEAKEMAIHEKDKIFLADAKKYLDVSQENYSLWKENH